MKQIEKIQFMRTRLSNFKNLLNEEATISNKIKHLSTEISINHEIQSQLSNYENQNNYENEIEIN